MTKTITFLREMLWVGYALYFQHSQLQNYLQARVNSRRRNEDLTQLGNIVGKLDQTPARSYLGQIIGLCLLAALPYLFLGPNQQFISPIVYLLTFFLLIVSGIGVAIWDGALGIVTPVLLTLLLGLSVFPGYWVSVLLSEGVLSSLRTNLLNAGIGLGLIIGLFIGGGEGVLANWRQWTSYRAFAIALVVVFGTGLVFVSSFAIGMAIGLTFIVAFGIVIEVSDYELKAFVAAFAVAGIVAFGVAFVGAFVVAFSLVFDVTFAVALVIVVNVSLVVVGVVVVTVTIIVAFGIPLVVAFSVGVGVGFGVAYIVAVSTISIPVTSTVGLLVLAFLIGWFLGSRPWTRTQMLISLGGLVFLSLVFIPDNTGKIIPWLLTSFVGFFHLPLYLYYAILVWLARPLGRPTPTPWRWDEFIPFSIPFLDQLLVSTLAQDREAGLALVAEVANSWRQGPMAEHALNQFAAQTLLAGVNERAISRVSSHLGWLPVSLPDHVQNTLGRFHHISRLVNDKLSLSDSEAQLAQLGLATAAVQELIQGLTFVPSRERALFLPVAQHWQAILRQASTRIPNVYVAGDPLRGNQTGLFVGRQDILRQLQTHLQDRSQRPTLVLFGQRRMGKSSLLYQLPYLFDEQTVPVRIDCQAAEMQESNSAFLFNLARAIHQQALQQRQLTLPPIPTLSDISPTQFNLWLEEVETVMADRVLLLCLDEFESIGEAVSQGWLDERILGFLRNLIQHHSQVILLLAGSHRPQEIGVPWSSYLISAVVLPISYLSSTEAERLITEPQPGFPLRYQSAAVQHIIDLTRCQPLLVQLLCQQIVILLNERGEREATIDDVESTVPTALSQGGSLYFTYLAEYDAGTAGQRMLAILAQRGEGAVMTEQALTEGDPDRQQALTRLLSRDLVERADGGIRFQVELTRRWWETYGASK